MSKRVNLPKQKSPLKVIRMMCIECMGGDSIQACKDLIRDCASKACPNYEMRFGRNPYNKHRGNIKNIMRETPEKAGAGEKFREIVS
jgi:hypothetical protein